MCGILGIVSRAPIARSEASRMLCAIAHRGPDDDDIWQDTAAGVTLGHRRLAVIDLSPTGRQPMMSHDGRFCAVFNGEIYNHLEIRRELESRFGSIAWRGHSDTETLLEGIARLGVSKTVEMTVGMFALAVWDRAERCLSLARDRFGEKPLYYGWCNDSFIFASELSPFQRFPGFQNVVDRDVAALYLKFKYVPAPYSIYSRIFKLEPGCIMTARQDVYLEPPATAPFNPHSSQRFSISAYWSTTASMIAGAKNPIHDEEAAIDLLDHRLRESVAMQSVADVPLGAFLSGGIDSTTIVALMQAQSTTPVRTFTIGFEAADFDEADHARAVASHLGTDHTELRVTPEHALSVIERLPRLYSEPFADASQIPTFLVAEMTRRHVTVALSGDAGDELFGGYNRYFWGDRIWKRVGWMPQRVRHAMGAAMLAIPTSSYDAIGRRLPGGARITRPGDKAHKLADRMRTVRSMDDLYLSLVSDWGSEPGIVPGRQPLRTIVEGAFELAESRQAPERMMLFDTLSYLPDDILQKVDRAAMGVGLETRVPFLDHRVAELAWRLPLQMKLRDRRGKWILRRVLDRYVPRHLVDRPKAGFGVPIGSWLRGPLRDWAEHLVSEDQLKNVGLLDPAIVRRRWREHLSGRRDWVESLWGVLMLQAWSLSTVTAD